MTTTTAQKSTRQLFADLFRGLKNLAREHIEEVKIERAEEKEKVRRAPLQIGLAAGLTLIGAILAAETLALVLVALGLPMWAGHAIIAAILLVVGVILLKRAPKPADLDTVPESAIKRIGHDIKELAQEVRHEVRGDHRATAHDPVIEVGRTRRELPAAARQHDEVIEVGRKRALDRTHDRADGHDDATRGVRR
jgi:hypothetical protein